MLRFFRTSSRVLAPAAMTEAKPLVALPLVRVPADRGAHLDDHHLVFWNAEISRLSAEQLSTAAAAWHQAVAQRPAALQEEPRLARA